MLTQSRAFDASTLTLSSDEYDIEASRGTTGTVEDERKAFADLRELFTRERLGAAKDT